MSECLGCKGSGRIPTDLWDKTGAMWMPCPHCRREEVNLWSRSTEQEKINWFSKDQFFVKKYL